MSLNRFFEWRRENNAHGTPNVRLKKVVFFSNISSDIDSWFRNSLACETSFESKEISVNLPAELVSGSRFAVSGDVLPGGGSGKRSAESGKIRGALPGAERSEAEGRAPRILPHSERSWTEPEPQAKHPPKQQTGSPKRAERSAN